MGDGGGWGGYVNRKIITNKHWISGLDQLSCYGKSVD